MKNLFVIKRKVIATQTLVIESEKSLKGLVYDYILSGRLDNPEQPNTQILITDLKPEKLINIGKGICTNLEEFTQENPIEQYLDISRLTDFTDSEVEELVKKVLRSEYLDTSSIEEEALYDMVSLVARMNKLGLTGGQVLNLVITLLNNI